MGPGRDFLCSVCRQENPQKAVLCTENTNKQMKVLHLFSQKTQKTHVFTKLYFLGIHNIFKSAQK